MASAADTAPAPHHGTPEAAGAAGSPVVTLADPFYLHAADILESITDAFVAVDREWRFTYVNRQAEALFGAVREELLGRIAWDEFPDLIGSAFFQQFHRAMAEGTAASLEEFYPPLDAWLEVRAFPSGNGLSVFFQNVTERVERQRRERFLADLAERARGLIDPGAVIADTVRSVGEFLGLSRCVFADIDIGADTCTIPADYCADASVASMAGLFPISNFGPFLVAEYGAGRTVVVDDVRLHPDWFPPEYLTAYEAVACRAFIAVPVLHSARLVSVIAGHSAAPRHWKREEVELVQTVVERTWLTVKVIRQQHSLVREAEERREAHEHTSRILESITDGLYVIDRDWRFSYVNAQAERMLSRTRDELLGRGIWEVYPDGVGNAFYQLYHRAMEDGRPGSIEDYYAPLDAWMDVRVYPSVSGLSVFFQNVNARRRSEEALRQSEERYRLLVEGARDYAMILMDAEGCVTFWNAGAERILGWPEAEVLGQPADLIFTPEDRALGVPARELGRAKAEGRALNLRWHLRNDGSRFFADGITEGLHDENGLLRGFAMILRDATERKALEDERARFVSMAENSTDFIGMSDLDDNPLYLNPAGLSLVGLSDVRQATEIRGIEFFHPDDQDFILNDLLPRVLRDGHGQAEVRLRHFGTGGPIWVNYTLFTLTDGEGWPVGFATISRDITERKALDAERERLTERERNIATQLQAALQPDLPAVVPGLALAKYYEVALAEAGVGGDFWDVFRIGEGDTALVIGDVSGKGLAAAAQVATVRNMLRALLYTRPTLADAVMELNQVLAENGLLTGFATLFVGTYDSATGTLKYVNCGQEPGLVRRAGGEIEELRPTGPLLGVFQHVTFEERTATLRSGDAVALFTDGLTEVGRLRQAMLGIEGVADLLAVDVPEEDDRAEAVAERLALRLIGGVDAAAQDEAIQDDVCLLIAVVE